MMPLITILWLKRAQVHFSGFYWVDLLGTRFLKGGTHLNWATIVDGNVLFFQTNSLAQHFNYRRKSFSEYTLIVGYSLERRFHRRRSFAGRFFSNSFFLLSERSVGFPSPPSRVPMTSVGCTSDLRADDRQTVDLDAVGSALKSLVCGRLVWCPFIRRVLFFFWSFFLPVGFWFHRRVYNYLMRETRTKP